MSAVLEVITITLLVFGAVILLFQSGSVVEEHKPASLRQFIYWLIHDTFTGASSIVRSAFRWLTGPGPEKQKRKNGGER